MLITDKSAAWPYSTSQDARKVNACDLIIFDCDGVLLDSEIIAARVNARAFARAGWPVTEIELIRRFTGIPDAEMFETVARELGRPLPVDHGAFVKAETERAFQYELKAIAGVHDVLANVQAPKCIASSSTPAKLKLGLSLTGLYEQFAPHIFSATMVARGKPAPDLYLFAAEQMGCAPPRCMAIEDSIAGVQAAVSAEIPVIGFCGASHCSDRHAEELAAAGAMMTIGTMSELGVILTGLAAPIGKD